MAVDTEQANQQDTQPDHGVPEALHQTGHDLPIIETRAKGNRGENQQEQAQRPDIAKAGANLNDLPEVLLDDLQRRSIEENHRLLHEGEEIREK